MSQKNVFYYRLKLINIECVFFYVNNIKEYIQQRRTTTA